ncbi:putative threonylcarbamoyl-AMP synthase [Sceloporus undulatus]|uniref:putative threonylcarbamoyl-AMP synthase n=1 Tax=Sceloporus undulatus TaxID=8520 RepID=UPI001C4CBB77|nr:putative threonylcarbamoyl-AMP synthase [Sceloporus undulatus]
MEMVVVCFLLFTVESLPVPLEVAMLTLFSLICLYGATASLANCVFGKELLLMGSPLLRAERAEKESKPLPPCVCPSSHRTSGLRTIADKLTIGGVCGIPTDTVYALAASCKHPKAIEKIYRIKDRPQEKPICIFISNLGQLREASPPFSPLLWEFMENVYPGGIGCIVQKGEWLKKLGIGAGYDHVGTKESIMIRVPDQTVTVHLIDMTGPLAITSANPSGETDSTHHDMVISRLGHKLEGVLCDGESNELMASTVVNCTQIDEVGITILREGCIPAAKVMQIFEKVKNHRV